MKLTRLSLVAIVVSGLVSSSFGADTLADAFKNGKITGVLKAFYFERDTGDAVVSDKKGDASLFSTGIMLNYITDSFMGLKMGVTFQSNHAPFADEDAKKVFVNDMYGVGEQLSEAYLSYTLSKTTVTAGRMFLNTPLVSNSGSRMTKDSFEGATIVNTDLPDTTIGFGYIDKWQPRTNFPLGATSGDIGEFKQLGDGAYTLFAINKTVPGLMLSGAWAGVTNSSVAEGDIDLYRFEAKYDGKASNFTYNLGGQYFITEYSATTPDSDGYAFKAGVGVGSVDAYVAYSKISNEGKVKYGLGYGADTLYTQSPIISDNYEPGTEAYAIDIAYKFNDDAKIGIDYTQTEDPIRGDLSYSAVYGSYAFGGALKGFSVLVQYEKEGQDGNDDELRVKTYYKF